MFVVIAPFDGIILTNSSLSVAQKKIEKRGRKLVDYDSQRHTFQALQTSKKREEVKIARAKEQLEEVVIAICVFKNLLNRFLHYLFFFSFSTIDCLFLSLLLCMLPYFTQLYLVLP